MQNREKNIQEEIEKTMQSLDELPRLKGNPWLFDRIEAQLNTTEKPSKTWTFSHVLQPVIVCCLLLVNVYTAYTVFSNSSITEDLNTENMESEYSYMTGQSTDYYIPE